MIDLWNPTHVSFGVDLLTAFLLGLVHGVTPDEHTWPITFSYAVGGYSSWRGFRAGLTFAAAFAVQQALGSTLAWYGLAGWFTFPSVENVVYLVVGLVMAWAGLFIMGGKMLPHFDLPGGRRLHALHEAATCGEAHDLKPWMPALHGFVAGWGFDAFSIIIYTVIAPSMPSAATAWMPGAAYGLGTLVVQAAAGALFGLWTAHLALPHETVRRISLTVAARTLLWGGLAFVAAGGFGLAFPGLAEFGIPTGLHVHNLDTIGLPVLLVVFCVVGVGVTSLVNATRALRNRPARG